MKAKPSIRGPVKNAPSMTISKEEQKWRAEDDMRTLLRAEEIKSDRARLAKASAVAKKQMAAVAKVAKAKK